ncbi:MAG TPA: MFS transporter [Thermohalobaculum sp.]|nr:MFS transporter [Thermohalobaculum sp.]
MADDDTQRRRTFRRMLILLGCFFVLVQINRSAGGVLATYLGAVRGLSPTDIGAVMGVMFFSSAVVQLPTGIMFDWLGPRRTLTYLGLVAVAGLIVFATVDEVWGMMAGRFAMGVGHGGVITGVYLFAMAWAPPKQIAQATATVVSIAGGLGGILATTPLDFALGQYGLSATFLWLAAATAVVTLVLHVTLQDRPADAPGVAVVQAETLGQTISGLLVVMRMPELRRIFAMGLCFSAPFMTLGGLWAGPYFTTIHNLDGEAASLFLLSLIVALHIGTFCYGPLERLAQSRKRLILTGVGIEISALSVLVVWPDAPLAIAGASLFVFALAAPFFLVLAAHARIFVPARRVGRAITCITLVGLTGVFVMQLGTGALIDLVANAGGTPATGYRLVFLSVIGILLVSGLIYWGQPETPDGM